MKYIVLTLAAITTAAAAVAQQTPLVPTLASAPVVAVRPAPQAPLAPLPPMPEFEFQSLPEPELQDNAADDGLSKTFSKSFSISASDKINISNQFGSITIRTWDRKEVKADVTISAYSNDAGEQQKLLDGVRIEAEKSGDQVSFKTDITTNRNGNWGNGTRNGRKWRREVKVHYVLYMPAANALNVSQQYGNVVMPAFTGTVNAKVQYGNFSAERLSNSSNNINVQYGKMNIQDLNNGNLKQQYGGGITLGTARNINVNAQYSNVTIDKVLGEAVLNVQYNKVRIAQVAESSKVLNINVQYGGVDVGFSDSYKGHMDVRTSYGSFKFDSGVSAKIEGGNEDRGGLTKSYTGSIGGGGSGQVVVKSAYGSVTFR